MKTQYIEEITQEYTVDLLTLKDGRVVGINNECIVLYESMDEFCNCSTNKLPTITIPPKKAMSDDAMATIATDAAHAAIAYIQNKIGQIDGDFAGDFFSSEERWNTLTTVLFDYLNAEIKSGLLLKK